MKPEKVFKKKTIFKCDYGDLERLIKAEYGHEYDIPCCEETSNDVSLEFNVNGQFGYDKEDVQKFKETGDGMFLLSDLLDDMMHRGVIEKGEYIVRISW